MAQDGWRMMRIADGSGYEATTLESLTFEMSVAIVCAGYDCEAPVRCCN
jgi:hypothetical protein